MIVDWQRSLLLAVIVAVFAVLFIRWNEFREERLPAPRTAAQEGIYVPDTLPDVEVSSDAGETAIPNAPDRPVELEDKPAANGRLVTVETDVLRLVIDTHGGDLVRTELLRYPLSQEEDSPPFVMLDRTRQHTYIAQSGLIGPNGTDGGGGRPKFQVGRQHYELGDQEQLRIPLMLQQGDTVITKEFVVNRGDYLIEVRYRVDNQGQEPWIGQLFGQIQRDRFNPVTTGTFGMQPYLGAALSTQDQNYKKLSFDDLQDRPFKTERTGGWVAMVQHYFVASWIPARDEINQYQLRRLGDRDLFILGFVGEERRVGPGQTGEFGAGFYVGPKDQDRLGEIAAHLELTIDYGWLLGLAKPLFTGLKWLHALLGNWGWAIVALTVLIKLVFFPLSAASYRSMAKMRKLQPEMLSLRERYSDDRQKLSQEVMALYKREQVNPMGGCLPMLIQMPVFIALYWVLSESVELRQAPWILWITDLSMRDPLYVLPVLNGISMYVLQTLQPAPPDPTQAKIMKIMPVAFSFFFVLFPAGLVLYWTVNSILSIAQQWVITKRIEAS